MLAEDSGLGGESAEFPWSPSGQDIAQWHELPMGTAISCAGDCGRGQGRLAALSPGTVWSASPAINPWTLPKRAPGGALGSKSQPLSEEAGG